MLERNNNKTRNKVRVISRAAVVIILVALPIISALLADGNPHPVPNHIQKYNPRFRLDVDKLIQASNSYGTIDIDNCPPAGCIAEPIFIGDKYVGCVTCVDGHGSLSDAEGLTELGCSTFCSSL